MLFVEIDSITPCLVDTSTGDIIETEVLRIRRKSFLSKFNVKTGWIVDWADLADENEIYALVIKGTADIQGLIALHPEKELGYLFLTWAVAAPQNNKLLVDEKKYSGVGGHLFAIAASKSFEYGFDGAMMGFAANRKLVEHYCTTLGATHLGILHDYQIAFNAAASRKLLEVYTYEWCDDEL